MRSINGRRVPLLVWLVLLASTGVVTVPYLYESYNVVTQARGLFEQSLQTEERAVKGALRQRIIEIAPKSAYGHFAKGWFLTLESKYAEAESEYKEALLLKQDFDSAHTNLGDIYATLGRREEALDQYQHALVINPRSANAHNNLGTVYLDLGRREEAVAEFQKALEINPRHFHAQRNLFFLSQGVQ